MEEATYLTRKEFAESIGCTPAYISKLGSQKRLVLSEDGKRVNVAATKELLKMSSDPSKVGVTARHERERAERDVGRYTKPDAPDIPDVVPDGTSAVFVTGEQGPYHKARANREHFLALQAENEYYKQIGALVEREKVEAAAFKLGRLQRDIFMSLPTKIAPLLAPINDSWELEKALREAIRNTLSELAKMAEQDMKNAMN